MREFSFLPAGLARLRHRAAAFLEPVPFRFIGIVVAVAVTFRLVLGVVQPVSAETEPDPTERQHVASTDTKVLAAPAAAPTLEPHSVTPSVSTSRGAGTSGQRPKPRTHGRR